MKLYSCQLARETETACIWMYVHTHRRSLRTPTVYLPSKSTRGFWLYLGLLKAHCSACTAAGPIMISMQIYIWLLLYLCFVDEVSFTSVSAAVSRQHCFESCFGKCWYCCCIFYSLWQPIYNWTRVWCRRSVKLCWAWPLPSCHPAEGPGGRPAACDRVHGHFLCHDGVTEKKLKASGFAARDLQMLPEGRVTVTYNKT